MQEVPRKYGMNDVSNTTIISFHKLLFATFTLSAQSKINVFYSFITKQITLSLKYLWMTVRLKCSHVPVKKSCGSSSHRKFRPQLNPPFISFEPVYSKLPELMESITGTAIVGFLVPDTTFRSGSNHLRFTSQWLSKNTNTWERIRCCCNLRNFLMYKVLPNRL